MGIANFFFPLGSQELIIVLVIVLVLFGSTKLPGLMKGLGEGMREFKKASKELNDDEPPSKQLAEGDKKAETSLPG